jgi:hypothetical protein
VEVGPEKGNNDEEKASSDEESRLLVRIDGLRRLHDFGRFRGKDSPKNPSAPCPPLHAR